MFSIKLHGTQFNTLAIISLCCNIVHNYIVPWTLAHRFSAFSLLFLVCCFLCIYMCVCIVLFFATTSRWKVNKDLYINVSIPNLTVARREQFRSPQLWIQRERATNRRRGWLKTNHILYPYHSGDVIMVKCLFMIFEVFDPSPLTVCINCSFYI